MTRDLDMAIEPCNHADRFIMRFGTSGIRLEFSDIEATDHGFYIIKDRDGDRVGTLTEWEQIPDDLNDTLRDIIHDREVDIRG